jgi:hypothetical protein
MSFLGLIRGQEAFTLLLELSPGALGITIEGNLPEHTLPAPSISEVCVAPTYSSNNCCFRSCRVAVRVLGRDGREWAALFAGTRGDGVGKSSRAGGAGRRR